ncbi:MAG TPA: hypothetical protein VIV40_17755 [Kofleriaceae bacterium]
MRWLALAPLFAATGCNWIYGLDKTELIDAAPPSELPPGLRTKLVWAIATTDGMGTIDPMLEYKAIGSEPSHSQQPVIQVGDDTSLMDAAYDLADGTFEIPYSLRESPHRIVYTLPGESVPNEVQWSLTNAFIAVPRTTRYDAPIPPSASGYSFTPMGLGGSLLAPVLITSGAFTYSANGSEFNQSGSNVQFPFATSADPVAGPLGAPQTAKGDWVLLAEYTARTAQQSSFGGWSLAKIDLSANTMVAQMPEPTWNTTTRTMSTLACTTTPADCVPGVSTAPTQQRLDSAVGAVNIADQIRHMSYGVSPSTELPGFLPGVAPLYIERPLILSFLESTQIDSTLAVADPSAGLGLERVITARLSNRRVVDGVTLTSSIQTITNVFSGAMPFPAPFAKNVVLGTTDLSTADSVIVSPTSGVQKLRWEAESGFKADDYVVTLYELTATSLAPVRIYHVLSPEVKVDGNLLAAGHHYAFAITARSGFPGAATGDFGTARYPFGSTTTFARTFNVQ